MDRVRITCENPDTSSDMKSEHIHENDKNSITINCENNIKMEKQLNTEFIIKEEILEDIDVNMVSGHIEEGLEDSFTMEHGGRIKNEVLNDCYSLECIPIKNEKLENSTTLINYENIKLEKQLNTELIIKDETNYEPVQDNNEKKSFSCDICNKTFTQKGYLAIHKRIHTGEKPFSCDICNKTFTHQHYLVVHKRIHTGEKPFSCDVCNKTFTQNCSLVIHKRIHTGEKRFSINADGNTCSENRVMAMAKIYREIQCTPIFDAKKQCPRAYDCQIFRTINANPNKCYWNNTEYEVGSQLPNELTEMDCFASCYCSSSKDLRRTELNIVQAGFRCANIECPSDVDYNDSPPEEGCHYEHNLRTCCPSGIICPHKDRIIRQSCMVDGQKILHGMRIEPSNSECSSCVCNDGKVECREVNCGVQLLHLNDLVDGVGVLFYGEGKCCPIGYVWPTGNEVIRPRALISRSNNDQTFQCKFGNLTVGIGDEVITSETNENTKCACLVPPLITCIQQPHSD